MKSILKYIAKSLSYLFDYLGVYHCLRYLRKNQILILMYHGISKEDIRSLENYDGKYVYCKLFEQQLLYLMKHYNLISLDCYANARKKGNKLPRNSVILTFDDGYKNNFTVLAPLIKKYRFPVTIYLSTGQIEDSKIPWSNAITFIIANTRQKGIDVMINGHKQFYDFSSRKMRFKSIIGLKIKTKSFNEERRKSFLKELISKAGVILPEKDNDLFLMSWKEISYLNDSLGSYISFGSHTLTHPYLTELSSNKIKEELQSSKELLRKRLGKPVSHFSYPYGAYDGSVVKILKNAGYSSAVTTEYGYNNEKTDLFRLRRIVISNNNGMAFFMLGLFFDLNKYLVKIMGVLSRLRSSTK